MKLLIKLAVAFSVLTSAVVFAEENRFQFSGEWLYMQPSIDQPYYVINSQPIATPRGERLANSQDWKSGYRVEGLYRFCGGPNQVQVRWTDFDEFTQSADTSGFLFSTMGIPSQPFIAGGTATIRDTFHFRTLDALVGRELCSCCPFYFTLSFGVNYSYLELNEHIDYVATGGSNTLINLFRSRTIGVGPEVGIDFRYSLLSCLHLIGRGSGAYLISNKKRTTFDQLGTIPINVTNVEESYVIANPMANLRFGLTLSHASFFQQSTLCRRKVFGQNMSCGLEVGYEIIYLSQGISRPTFTDQLGDGTSFTSYMDFMLHGPYLSFQVLY